MYPSDEELIGQVKRKDKQAFVILFDRYKNKILSYLYGYLRDHELAHEVALDTFMSAYNKLRSYRGEGKFSSWLYAIATNKAKNALRDNVDKRLVSLEEKIVDKDGSITLADLVADDSNRPDYNMKIAEQKMAIYKLLSKLDEKYREVLLLCDARGLTYEEAAEVLKENPATIGTRARRARKKLYEIIKEHKSEL